METSLEKEMELIRKRLDSLEEAVAEEMTEDDRRAFDTAMREHDEGRSIPFARPRKR